MNEPLKPHPEKEDGNYNPLLRDILVDTTFKPGRAISPDIKSLDLGVFLEEAQVLARECFLDPDYSNAGKAVYVTGAKKVLVPERITQAIGGEPLQLLYSVSKLPKVVEKNRSDDRNLGMILHTSGNTDHPFSITGVAMLLEQDASPFSTSAVFVVGRTENMIIFRGENTPQLPSDEVDKKVKLWIWQLLERLNKFIEPGMVPELKTEIENKAQRALLRQICEKYDLSYFAGPTDSPTVTRQSPL